jgi:hypothetical protein
MVEHTPSGSILPPFNNRHHSLAPESFGTGNAPLVNLNNAKITDTDRSQLKIKGPRSVRNASTPERSGEQSIGQTNNNFLKDPVFEFDDGLQQQKARFETQLKLKQQTLRRGQRNSNHMTD